MKIRSLSLAVGMALCLLAPAVPVGARHVIGARLVPVPFGGVVTALAGPPTDPVGFTLQLANRSLDFRIDPKATTFTAHSAEAEVEGFQVDDFATVTARRVNREWVADRIVFDVQPFGQIRIFAVTGTVTRVSPDGKRLAIKLGTGVVRVVGLTKNTKFLVDGQAVEVPPTFSKGNVVQVLVRRTRWGWAAIDVNLKTGAPGSGS